MVHVPIIQNRVGHSNNKSNYGLHKVNRQELFLSISRGVSIDNTW